MPRRAVQRLLFHVELRYSPSPRPRPRPRRIDGPERLRFGVLDGRTDGRVRPMECRVGRIAATGNECGTMDVGIRPAPRLFLRPGDREDGIMVGRRIPPLRERTDLPSR